MKSYSLSHLADHLLVRELSTLLEQDRITTASLLAHLAEFDARKLYLPAGHPSMFAYCVRELHMPEDSAFKRIRAARTARDFPAIFPALAGGRLHLSAVVLLAPHLRPDNADELLAAATHKSKAEIELLLAERFPQPDVPTLVRALAPPAVRVVSEPAVREAGSAPSPSPELANQQGVGDVAPATCENVHELAPGPVVPSDSRELAVSMEPLPSLDGPPAVPPASPRTKIAPLSPGRFSLQLTVARETYEQLRYAQALLGHAVPSGDVAEVLKRALGALVKDLEKQKLAMASRTRSRRGGTDGRYIPAEVRRTVWQRDGGRCTFTSDSGHRCEARTRLEFDHIEPVARGGRTTAANTRLRCRGHNQYTAERTYGAGFMREKREQARHLAAEKRARSRLAPASARRNVSAAIGAS